MPIPLQIPPAEDPERKGANLHLVNESNPSPDLLVARIWAHLLDITIVAGFSLYFAKISTAALVSLHMPQISKAGRVTASLVREVYSHGNGSLLLASFLVFSSIYFISLPVLAGRTLGMGIFGLRVVSENATEIGFRQAFLRFLGCGLSYFSGGLLCFVGLRKRSGRFLHDQISETKVIRA